INDHDEHDKEADRETADEPEGNKTHDHDEHNKEADRQRMSLRVTRLMTMISMRRKQIERQQKSLGVTRSARLGFWIYWCERYDTDIDIGKGLWMFEIGVLNFFYLSPLYK
ncbi:unnamed protein product, partial [Owenia fusiformis]